MDKYDTVLKIIVIGDAGVGKSSISATYCENKYSDNYTSTIGVDFYIKTVNVNGKRIKLQIWDTAGQERYRSITTGYYKSAVAVILVFDMTDTYSFSRLDYW